MRQGISPAKRAALPAHQPTEVGVASLVFIPALTGFYAQALDVLDLHLRSLRHTLPEEGEILVWDNGSCPEVVQFLEQVYHAGHIDYLILSKYNLGKAGMLNWVLKALPHRYIVYTDSDILFLPGWWKAVQEVFRAFPKAGMVSPAPAFFDVLRGNSRTPTMLSREGFEVYMAQPTPQDALLYYRGLGYEMPAQLPSLPFAKAHNGLVACARSGHHVFVMPRPVAQKLSPLPIKQALSSQSDRLLHEQVEAQGYWQLSTSRGFVYHLGNTTHVPELLTSWCESLRHDHRITARARRPAQASSTGLRGTIREMLRRLLKRSPWLRQRAERLYGLLFRLLYGEAQ